MDEHLADAGGFPFVLDRRSFRREGPGDYLGRSENGELVNIEFDRHQATVTTTWTTTNPTVTHTRTDRYHRHPDGSLTRIGNTITVHEDSRGNRKIETGTPESGRASARNSLRLVDGSEPSENTTTPHPSGRDGSQPREDGTGAYDPFCDKGVTNPDGPGGSRRKPPRARGSDDRNIPDPSGVIIQRDPPPTPEELKRMVTQPGVDGEVPGGGGGGGGRRPSDFAQPPAGGPGGDVSPASPNLPGVGGLPGPIEAPSIPKPSDPERG